MAAKRQYYYEAMFLIGQNQTGDLAGVVEHVKEIIARGHGEIVAMKKWDERRLAYEVSGQKRGLYILTYFKAPGVDVAHIERDCNLSERIMRTLILRADHLTLEEMQANDGRKELEIEAKMRASQTTAPATAAPAEPAAQG